MPPIWLHKPMVILIDSVMFSRAFAVSRLTTDLFPCPNCSADSNPRNLLFSTRRLSSACSDISWRTQNGAWR